jgi:hypothetical protein
VVRGARANQIAETAAAKQLPTFIATASTSKRAVPSLGGTVASTTAAPSQHWRSEANGSTIE